MATMDEILNAIKTATADEKKAFKSALGVSDSEDISGFDYKEQEKILKQQLQIEKERAEILSKSAGLMGDVSKSKEQQAEAVKKEVQLALELEKISIAQSNLAEEDKKKEISKLNIMLDQVKAGRELSENLSFSNTALNNSLNTYKKIVPAQQKINDLSRETKENINDFVEGMGSIVGLTDKVSGSRIGKMTQLFETIGKGGAEAGPALEELTRSFQKMFSVQNIAMNVFSKVFSESMKVLNAFDEASASMAATTGTVGKFNDVLYDTQRAGNLLGVEMSQVASAITTLNAQTSNFAKLSKRTQTDLAIATTQFEKLGVTAQDTAEFMENAFKIMNMGATEAIQVQKELAMAGVELGIGADKIIKDFNAASKTLAVYGKNSIGIFKNLAAQAKAAGVEVSTLMGMVEKYDTFAGAAEGAAQFNALLGTQLSTTEMLMMTEDERMKTLVESVQAQGIAFKDMDKYTQKAIAAAAGISDMNEANRIFGMSLADYEANRREMENNAAAQAKFDEAVQATVPTMKKFQNLATEMIVLVQPALEQLGEVADYLTDFFQKLDKETKETIGTIALFTAGILTLAPIFAVGGGFMAGLAAVGPAIAGIGVGVANALGAISAAVVASGGIAGGVIAALIAGGGVIGATMSAMAASEAKIAEANAKMISNGSETIKSMAEIGNADFSGIASKFKGVMEELNKMGGDVKVTSTLQNLALIGAGTAFDMTGAKIAASTTNVTANIQNIFDNTNLILEVDGKQMKAIMRQEAAKVAVL